MFTCYFMIKLDIDHYELPKNIHVKNMKFTVKSLELNENSTRKSRHYGILIEISKLVEKYKITHKSSTVTHASTLSIHETVT